MLSAILKFNFFPITSGLLLDLIPIPSPTPYKEARTDQERWERLDTVALRWENSNDSAGWGAA